MTTRELKEVEDESEAFVLVGDFDEKEPWPKMETITSKMLDEVETRANIAILGTMNEHIKESKNNNRLDDNSSTGGWSEVSMPSSFLHSSDGHKSKQSWVDEQGQIGNENEGIARIAKRSNECEHNEDEEEERHGDNCNSQCGSDLQTKNRDIFSWAEITKIQPSFQKEDWRVSGQAKDANNHYEATTPTASTAAPSIAVTSKKSIVVAAVSQDKAISLKLSDVGDANVTQHHAVVKKPDLVMDKEHLEFNLRRPGKKRLRFKHSSGSRRGGKKNNSRKG